MEKLNIALYKDTTKCKKCHKALNTDSILIINQNPHFYCFDCNLGTIWSNGTIFFRARLNLSTIQNMLHLYLSNKSKQEACADMELIFKDKVAKSTISKYFDTFSEVIKKYYVDAHKNWILSGHIKIDETKLFKQKVSQANARPYSYGSVWILGFKQRNSKRFLIYPIESRDGDTFIPLLLKHVEISNSYLYTDSMSVYVNNQSQPPRSKIQEWGYKHYYTNHNVSFVNAIFSQIHTNTVERMWRSLKEHIKKHKPRKLYEDSLGRYFFLNTLENNEQINFSLNNVHVSELEE